MSEEKKKLNEYENFSIVENYRLLRIEDRDANDNGDFQIPIWKILHRIWKQRRIGIYYVVCSILVGILVSVFSEKEYEATTTLLPEYNNESRSGTSDLINRYGGLLGIGGGATYNSSSNAIRVELYPTIAKSIPFQKTLLDKSIYFTEFDTTITVLDYFLKFRKPSIINSLLNNTVYLPLRLFRSFANKETQESNNQLVHNALKAHSTVKFDKFAYISQVTKEELGVIENLKQRIEISINTKSGIVSVTARMPDAEASAILAEVAINQLVNYLTEYRTDKLKTDNAFLEAQLKTTKERFDEAQLKLLSFQEQNKGGLSPTSKTIMQSLQMEFELSSSLYKNFAQQLEQNKLKIQEETPLFRTLEPITVPSSKIEPSTKTIVILCVLIGSWVFVGVTFFSDVKGLFEEKFRQY